MLRIMTMMMIIKMMMVMMRRRITTRMIMTMLIMIMIFSEFATVAQHGKRGWNRTCVPNDINAFITHPTHKRLYHNTRVYAPYSLRTAVWVLLRPTRIRTAKELWDGAYGFSSLSGKTRSLTICRCDNKGSTFSSFILRPWVLVQMGFEPSTSHSAYCRLSNCANRAAVMMMMMMKRRRRRRRRRRMMMMLMMMILTLMMITMTMRKMTLMIIIMLALFIITIKATTTLKNKLLQIEHTTCPLIY